MAAWNPSDAGHDEDMHLVQAARDGDVSAFERLYRRHRDRIYGLVWRLCGGNGALAEDLLQEAFVRAWRKLDSFRGDSQFGTWLHRLSANVALSDRRLRMRRMPFETPLTESLESTLPAGMNQNVGLKRDLEAAVSRLPERARTVLVLHDIEGYKHAEIAKMTGMAVGSSKAQLHRARRLVREELEK